MSISVGEFVIEFTRRGMLVSTVAVASAAFAKPSALGGTKHFDRMIVIDGLGAMGDPYAPGEQLRLSKRAWAEIIATGVTVIRDTVQPVGNVADPWTRYKADVQLRHNLVAANPDRLILVRSAGDIEKAKRDKLFGIVLGTQDSSMVGPELDRLTEMKKDGIMTVQLTYNNRNLAGDGALESADAGLSRLGRATIERIEAEKLLLDLSHGGARTMAEAVAQSKRPLVISHTAARALTDHVRNTSDQTMKAVANKGGVVGVYFMPFLALNGAPKGLDLIRHIDHVANVVGEDHIGLGSDNGPFPMSLDDKSRAQMRKWQLERIRLGIAAPGETPETIPLVTDYNSVNRYRRLANDLERRGWNSLKLEKLFGRNFLRVYRETWGS